MTVLRTPPARPGAAPPVAPREPAERRFRQDIQGLRAVAVLLVVLHHAGITALSGGYVGVDVFFVVSGFVISRSLLGRQHSSGISLPAFYAARARRILPMSTVVLVVTVLASWGLLNFVRAGQVVGDALWATFFAANLRFAAVGTDYFAADTPPSPLQHYWSLAVEEQFYLGWPLLMGLLLFGVSGRGRRVRPRRPDLGRVALGLGVIIVVSLAWSIIRTSDAPVAAFYSPLTRAWELAVGALLAVGVAAVARVPAGGRAVLSWAGLAGILASALLFTPATPFPGAAALLPVLSTAAVIAGGTGGSRGGAGRLLALRPLRVVGDCSYSFYLWHWPILIIAATYAGRDLSLPANLVLVAGALLLSIATWQLIETPFRRGPWLRGGQRRSLALVPASIVVLLAVCAAATPALRAQPVVPVEAADNALVVEPRSGSLTPDVTADPLAVAVEQAVAAARAGQPVPARLEPPLDKLAADFDPLAGCFSGNGDTDSKICRLGDTRAERSIVVIGDSHAGMWVPALDAIGKRYGWVVHPLLKTSCASANVLAHAADSGSARECTRWRDWALKTAVWLQPDRVVMTNLLHGALVDERGRPVRGAGAASRWREGTASAARTLQARGARVTVLSDPPGVRKNPAECLLGRNATLANCLWPLTPTKQQLEQAVRAGALAAGASYADLDPWFCARKLCPAVIGSTVAYWDTHHVSRTYVLQLAPSLARKLKLDG